MSTRIERGARLAELRRQAGLLLRQVGDEFGIDKAAVAAWESGRTSPAQDKLERLDAMYDAGGEVISLFAPEPSMLDRIGNIEAMLQEALDRLAHLEAEAAHWRSLDADPLAPPVPARKIARARRRPGVA